MSEVALTDCCLAIWWVWISGQKDMAGNNGEQVAIRRLRSRDVTVAVPPAIALGNKENSRKTKASSKRAAMEDASNKAASAAPVQHAKKRAALADLTNISSVRSNTQASKSQGTIEVVTAKIKATAVPSQSKKVELGVFNPINPIIDVHEDQPKSSRKSETTSSITFPNDENSCPSRVEIFQDKKPSMVEVLSTGGNASQTLASLECCAQHDLYISKESRPCFRQGCLFVEHEEEEGCLSKNYTDIDSNKDPQMCSVYAADIYHHLRVAELKRRPSTNFMEVIQQEINASMRSILVDWLVEVAEEYKLVPDTLYLSVSYIDRFLSGNLVTRQRLQLLGVSCMLIASKYEEICAPQVEEFCYITDNTYNREEVLDMERRVLNHLHFELTGPTTKSFLRRFIRAAQPGQKTPPLQLEFLGNFLAELTLLEYSFLCYLPSMIAGAAVFMAKVILDPTSKPWNFTLQHYTGYKPSELEGCVKAIHDLHRNTKNCTLPAIREKYRQHKFKCVAMLASPDFIPPEYFGDLS